MISAGIDAGTQSIKVIIYDSNEKKVLALTSSPLDIISSPGGVREQKSDWWIEAIRKCFNSIDRKVKDEIEVITVSGQQHGFVPLSEDGIVLDNVKLWCDTSTAGECDEIMDEYGGKDVLIKTLGNAIMPGYTASKILAFKKNKPELYSKMRYVLLPHDYINYYLTGTVSMERGDASGTGLMNSYTSMWDEKICSIISPDLINKLPPITNSLNLVGRIKDDVALELGVKDSVMVSSGGGDNMMSAIGTGSVGDGEITMSLGTSGTLFSSSSKPLVDEKERLASFSSSHGTWLPLLCTMNCTVASEIMRGEMNLDVKEFDNLAEKAPIGSEGLVMLPFFNGERVPNLVSGEGVLAGMNMNNVKRQNIARATLEGVTYEFLLGLEAFKELGLDLKRITLTGGGAKSSFWRQLVSDMTGLEVRVPKNKEAAALGAALQGISIMEGRGIEDVSRENIEFDSSLSAHPNMSAHKEYKKHYEKWKRYVSSLTPQFSSREDKYETVGN